MTPGQKLPKTKLYAALVALLLTLSGCASTAYVQAQSERLVPVKLRSLGPQLQESSGLAQIDDLLWSMNDSDGAPELVWIDLEADRSGSVALNGATNFDWEALASNDEQLFLLDCGNNRGDRIWLQLYSIDRAELKQGEVEVAASDFRYADVPYEVARRAHNNDCEAAAWVNDRIWLFTKNWQDQQTRIYKLTPGLERQQLITQQSLNVAGLITGADYSSEHQMLALLGYGKGVRVLQPFIWLAPLIDGELRWEEAKRYELTISGQWEAILWQGDQLLLTREESMLGDAQVAQVQLPVAALNHQ